MNDIVGQTGLEWGTKEGLGSHTFGAFSKGFPFQQGFGDERAWENLDLNCQGLWTSDTGSPNEGFLGPLLNLEGENLPLGGFKNSSGGIKQKEASGNRSKSSKFFVKLDGQERVKHKKGKLIKESPKSPNLVFEVDLHFDRVMEASKSILVGRARGIIIEWINRSWVETLDREVEVITLSKGWFIMNFKNSKTLEWVLLRKWGFDIAPILFKKCTPPFDANREQEDEIPVWVRLPTLPPYFCTLEVFPAIRDNLGTFLEADMSFMETHSRNTTRILVKLASRDGLIPNIIMCFVPHVILLTY